MTDTISSTPVEVLTEGNFPSQYELLRAVPPNNVLVKLVVGITSEQTCLVLKSRLRMLRTAGFGVTLLSSPGKLLEKTAVAEGVGAYPLPMQRGLAPLADLGSFLGLLWFLYRHRPVITDFSTPKAGFLGNLAAWVVDVPRRVYTLRGLKLEATRGWERQLLLWTERVACRCAHVVLCNSESLAEQAVSLRLVDPSKVVLLGYGSSNGVDTRRFSPGNSDVRRHLGIEQQEVVLGFVGRLTKDKGVVELLMAFDLVLAHDPDAWLLLVGWFDAAEDALAERWRAKIRTHPRIFYVGPISDPAPFYRAMDVLILPTYREGFPNVVLEAAATGIPAIVTDCTGARDSVLPNVTGLLIPPANHQAISTAVLELIADPVKRLRMGRAAREWAVEYFEQKKVLALAVGFYRGLLEGKRRNRVKPSVI